VVAVAVPVLIYNLHQPVEENQELLTQVVAVAADIIQVVVLHKEAPEVRELS
jgi:hypothetical protein